MTPQQVTQMIEQLLAGGLALFGQGELAQLATLVGQLAVAVENAIQAPSPGTVLSVEVQAADAAADETEKAKFGS